MSKIKREYWEDILEEELERERQHMEGEYDGRE